MIHTVVIVEDELYLRKELLEMTPWEELSLKVIGEAGDGLEGEELISRLKPDLVLTDIRLPGQDGLSMLDHVLPRHAIIFSGHSDAILMQKAIRIGVDDYLFKPIDDEELLHALGKIVTLLDEEDAVARSASAEATEASVPLPLLPKKVAQHHVNSAIDFIEQNYQHGVGLQETAEALGISENHLSRLFHKETGFSFLTYITIFRLRRALDLLKDSRLNITEIYLQCGFRTGSYFAQIFRKYLGETPQQYRNRKM
jgi:two-component system response regulator YesN